MGYLWRCREGERQKASGEVKPVATVQVEPVGVIPQAVSILVPTGPLLGSAVPVLDLVKTFFFVWFWQWSIFFVSFQHQVPHA